MKVLICGSRGITDFKTVTNACWNSEFIISSIISGGARGVDTLAERYAKQFKLPIEVIKPGWEQFGKRAGILRNIEMIDKAEAVIAIWDGKSKGTKHSIDYAKSKGKEVYIEMVEL